MTTRWPRRPTVSTRPSASTAPTPTAGTTSTSSSSRPCPGCTGSTRDGCTGTATTSRQPNTRKRSPMPSKSPTSPGESRMRLPNHRRLSDRWSTTISAPPISACFRWTRPPTIFQPRDRPAGSPMSAPMPRTGSPRSWPSAPPTRSSARMLSRRGRVCPRAGRQSAARLVAQAGLHLTSAAPNRQRSARPGHDLTRALKNARWALWKNPENLTDRQADKLAWIAKTDPRLHRAYLLKEGLRHVFAVKGEPGKQALDRWLSWARRCRLPSFVRLARRIVNVPGLDRGRPRPRPVQRADRVHQHQDPTPHPHRLRVPLTRSPHRPRDALSRRPPTSTTRPIRRMTPPTEESGDPLLAAVEGK